jgi:catechol 2,3-dioxygenase-like lactoylglutathione lyase family enzyme
VHLQRIAILVPTYDEGIRFFVDALGFELLQDEAGVDEFGKPRRWVVVTPPAGETSIVLSEVKTEEDRSRLGSQLGSRVAFFLRVDDFDEQYARMIAAGVRFVTQPRDEPYGRVAIFEDLSGNRWDLLGPEPIN